MRLDSISFNRIRFNLICAMSINNKAQNYFHMILNWIESPRTIEKNKDEEQKSSKSKKYYFSIELNAQIIWKLDFNMRATHTHTQMKTKIKQNRISHFNRLVVKCCFYFVSRWQLYCSLPHKYFILFSFHFIIVSISIIKHYYHRFFF